MESDPIDTVTLSILTKPLRGGFVDRPANIRFEGRSGHGDRHRYWLYCRHSKHKL